MKYLDFDVIDSTNRYCKDNYQLLENLTFVSAKQQLAGKGRNDRIWESETDRNLLLSLLLKEEKYFERFGEISVLAAYSIVQVLNQYGIKKVSIKWPNDVYADDRKICGILLEGVSNVGMQALIIGIGLNVNQLNFSSEYIRQPVSMRMLLNEETDIQILKKRVCRQLTDNLEKMIAGYDFYPQFCKYSYLDGREVSAMIDGQYRRVKVIGINRDCSLKVICDNRESDLNTGEISFHKEVSDQEEI